jgi:outer membrane protein insertion porin family
VDPELLAIFEAKIPRKYTIADIKVTGNVKFDAAIVISVSGLSVGDEVTIPGGDNFAKAINKLWAQNMFTNINIFITKLEDRNIWVEIVAQERPMLSDFRFSGIRKGEAEELKDKVGLFKSRVVTDNMRLSALEAISKYYTEKGFQGAETKIKELPDPNAAGRVILEFQIDKGNKVRIDQVHFFGNNSVEENEGDEGADAIHPAAGQHMDSLWSGQRHVCQAIRPGEEVPDTNADPSVPRAMVPLPFWFRQVQ